MSQELMTLRYVGWWLVIGNDSSAYRRFRCADPWR